MSGGHETILLVEDDRQVRSIMASTLHSHGYQIVQASDGAEAITTFERHCDELHLVVLDVDLPKRSGLLCRDEMYKIRADIPVILTTGNVNVCFDKHLKYQDQVLCKPFQMSDLLSIVGRVVDDSARKDSS